MLAPAHSTLQRCEQALSDAHRQRVLARARGSSAAAGAWDSAARAKQRQHACLLQQYGPDSTEAAFEGLELASLLDKAGQPSSAAEQLADARRVFALHFGPAGSALCPGTS